MRLVSSSHLLATPAAPMGKRCKAAASAAAPPPLVGEPRPPRSNAASRYYEDLAQVAGVTPSVAKTVVETLVKMAVRALKTREGLEKD